MCGVWGMVGEVGGGGSLSMIDFINSVGSHEGTFIFVALSFVFWAFCPLYITCVFGAALLGVVNIISLFAFQKKKKKKLNNS